MTTVEVPYFGGPADGTVFVADSTRYDPDNQSWAIVCVGGYYKPERIAKNNTWRLAFVDTVKR